MSRSKPEPHERVVLELSWTRPQLRLHPSQKVSRLTLHRPQPRLVSLCKPDWEKVSLSRVSTPLGPGLTLLTPQSSLVLSRVRYRLLEAPAQNFALAVRQIMQAEEASGKVFSSILFNRLLKTWPQLEVRELERWLKSESQAREGERLPALGRLGIAYVLPAWVKLRDFEARLERTGTESDYPTLALMYWRKRLLEGLSRAEQILDLENTPEMRLVLQAIPEVRAATQAQEEHARASRKAQLRSLLVEPLAQAPRAAPPPEPARVRWIGGIGEIPGGRVVFIRGVRLNANLALAGEGEVLREYRAAQRDFMVYRLERGRVEAHYAKDRRSRYALEAQPLLDLLMAQLESGEQGLTGKLAVQTMLELSGLGEVLLSELRAYFGRNP